MRAGHTYRAFRRNEIREIAAENGDKFRIAWASSGVRQVRKPSKGGGPVERYEPCQPSGKIYAPNGKRECARRVQQADQRSN